MVSILNIHNEFTMKSIKQLQQENSEKVESRIKYADEKLPPRFKHVDLDQCVDSVTKWAYGKKDGKGLYLWGPVGTGKTYAAYALHKTILANGFTSKIGNSAGILQDIRDDFRYASRDPYYRNKFDDWVEYTGVLIIDDLGAEKPSEWALETFYTMINTRYENKRITIFTSNYSVEEIAGRLGDRIASRMVEMCEVIKLDGNDRRLT